MAEPAVIGGLVFLGQSDRGGEDHWGLRLPRLITFHFELAL